MSIFLKGFVLNLRTASDGFGYKLIFARNVSSFVCRRDAFLYINEPRTGISSCRLPPMSTSNRASPSISATAWVDKYALYYC
jgi:hypothetical protein